MSSPLRASTLTLPIAWPGSREQQTAAPKPAEERIPSDEEVMARVQFNDPCALEILFDRYARLVVRIARGIMRDRGEAEDVVQDTFLFLFQKSKLFDGSKGSVKNWIVQIALHRALDRKAHLARRGFYTGTDLGLLDDTLLGETDLDRKVEVKLSRTHLEQAFKRLTELQRLTLELFYFEGLELREISEKLNEPLGNTRHHFYRGLERLRKSSFVQMLR